MTALYHFWSCPEAQRVRLALHAKGVDYDDRPLDYGDDETFFELGVARSVPVLVLDDGSRLTDSLDILWCIDDLFPDGEPLVEGRIDRDAWDALIAWREGVDAVLQRLYAPIKPAYRDIADGEADLAAYKAEVQHRFGLGVEALANDRYAGYEQFEAMTRLRALSVHLENQRFYMGELSIADCVLTADLHPLQQLDGVTLPVALMYYLARVEGTCGLPLNEGLLGG